MKFFYSSKKLLSSLSPALLSGFLLGLACPSFPFVRLDFFAWFALVPLLRELAQVTSFAAFLTRSVTAMTVAFLLIPFWLLPASLFGYLAAALVGSIVWSAPLVVLYLFQKTWGWQRAIWVLPMLWTAWEWLYHQTELSFGAVRIGNTMSRCWWLVQYAELTGVAGVTCWIVLLNVGLAWMLEQWQAPRSRAVLRPALAFVIVMFGLPLLYTAWVFARDAEPTRSISVLMVQPNLDPQQTRDNKQEVAAVQRLVRITGRELATQKPDLILWPEGAVPFAVPQAGEAQEYLRKAVARWHTPLLTGTVDVTSENKQATELLNAAVLLVPDTQQAAHVAGVSHKIVPMPLVERVPYVDRVPALAGLGIKIGAGNFYAKGKTFTPLSFTTTDGAAVTVATPICYEQLYPELTAEMVRGGAQLLTVITNEGWFGLTHGQYQLAAFGALRAIETRRAIARAANTGVTAFVDRFGRFHQTVPWWSEQTLTGRVPLSDELTFYVRHPDLLPRTCVWLSLVLAIITSLHHLFPHSPFWHRSPYE